MTRILSVILFLVLVNHANAQPQNLPTNAPLPWTLSGNSNATLDSKLGTTTEVPLVLYTNNLERMRLTSDGRIGIGTNNPYTMLHVNGRGQFEGGLQANLSVNVVNQTNYYPALTSVAIGDPSVYAESFNSNGRAIWAKGHTAVYAESATGTGVNSRGYYYGLFGIGTAPNTSGIASVGVGGSGFYGMWGNGQMTGILGTGEGAGIIGNPTTSFGYGVVGYCSTGSLAGVFYGNVYTSGLYLGSDRKLKTNISDVPSAIDLINKLKPKSYQFREDGYYKQLNLPKGEHYGFIAQELEQVLPELIRETKYLQPPGMPAPPSIITEGDLTSQITSNRDNKSAEDFTFKSVNYIELIPLAIKGLQELSKENTELKQQLAELKQLVNKLSKEDPVTTLEAKAALLQNVPNPVHGSTSILYSLPAESKSAKLLITDNLGRTIQVLELNESGKLNLNTSNLASGVYNYSLKINDQTIQTRRMVIQN